MVTFDDVIALSKKPSDVQGQVIRLYQLSAQLPRDKVIVELGVDNGTTTIPLLAAVNDTGGHLYSVDYRDCSGCLVKAGFINEPNWTFILGNDLEVVKSWDKKIDHLFLDTVHTFEPTLSELRAWGAWVKRPHGIITLHDTDAPGSGVRKAIESYLRETDWTFTNFDGSAGLGLLERK